MVVIGAMRMPEKAPIAALIMASVVLAAMTGLLPIAIAAVLGATAMVLFGCLTMEEAYRNIEWPAVFLIASMLPLGIAMQTTGAAAYIAGLVTSALAGVGPRVMLGATYALGALAVQFIPNSAVAVLLAPIGVSIASGIGVSPNPMLMAVALSASAGFASPTGHAVNLMVMGPGEAWRCAVQQKLDVLLISRTADGFQEQLSPGFAARVRE